MAEPNHTDYGAHLVPSARALLDLPMEERILGRWPDLWIGHREAKDIHQWLDQMLASPRSSRPRNGLLYGESGVGKSTTLRRWARLANDKAARRAEEGDPAELGEWAVLPVLLFNTPPKGDETRLYNAMLEAFGYDAKSLRSLADKYCRVKDLIYACQVRVIVMDEFHNALSGRFDQRLHFNVVIKHITNETGIPFVVAGTDSVDQVFRKEDQLHRRFSRFEMKRWKQTADWAKLLTSFERIIPLAEPSRLFDPEISNRLFAYSNGIIGELSEILKQAAISAALSGKERIELDMIRPLN